MPAGIVFAHRGEFDEAERLLEASVRGTADPERAVAAGRRAVEELRTLPREAL